MYIYIIIIFQGIDDEYNIMHPAFRSKRPHVLPTGRCRTCLQTEVPIRETVLSSDVGETGPEIGAATLQTQHGQEHQDLAFDSFLFTGMIFNVFKKNKS